MRSDFTKRELIAIIDAIEAARTCTSESALNQVIKRVKGLVSAESCVCGLVRVEGGGLKEVLSVVNGDYPEEWLNIYMDEELYKRDPIVDYHMKFSMTQLWSDTFKLYDDASSMDLRRRASDFGLHHGITGGVHDQKRRLASIFSFACDTGKFGVHHKKIVDIATLHLHRALVRTYLLTRLTARPVSLPRNIN
jgi:hypothetical protein